MWGFKVTTPLRTIQDVIEVKTISHEFVIQAIEQGLIRGLFNKSQIKSLLAKVNVDDSVRKTLKSNLGKVAS